MTSSKATEIIKSGSLSSKVKDAVDIILEKLLSIDPFQELDSIIAESKDVIKVNILRFTAIVFLTEDNLEILGSRDGADSDLSDEDECEQVALKVEILSTFLKTNLFRHCSFCIIYSTRTTAATSKLSI